MSFRTKLDYSDNRQIQQRPETLTILSGGTSFGLTFNALTTGPDLLTSGITSSFTSAASTFSGNSTTTVYNWYDPIMSLGYPTLTALTPSTSADTQYVTAYSANTTTTIDGNTVALDYVGVTYDITCSDIYDLGGGAYSGTAVSLELDFLTASTLDFTGRTIWADVSGITRTERFIVTNDPQIGYVLMCYTSEGMAKWEAVTGVTISGGSILWSSGTGTYSIAAKNHDSIASGDYSVAEGYQTTAIGNHSHAEGYQTIASGGESHAEGIGTLAGNYAAHAEGYQTIASGGDSHAEGNGSIASADNSHAEGLQTRASGAASHAEGVYTTAIGGASHAEGQQTTAIGSQSHAEGYDTTASGIYGSHSEGYGTIASGDYGSHAEGYGAIASGNYGSHAEGNETTASGTSSHAEGSQTTAIGSNSHAEGDNTEAIGNYGSHAEGNNTTAIGDSSHAEGKYTEAIGNFGSHAEGNNTTASGSSSHAEGIGTLASGQASHAEGWGTIASNNNSHAEGLNTRASGLESHAEGAATTASGNYSHSGGISTSASGETSFVHGRNSIAGGTNTVVLGLNITGTTSNMTYVDKLNIKTLGAGPGTSIAVDGTGQVVYTTSDFRLKENISTLTNALDKVKNLRGVSFQLKDRNAGGEDFRFGFIAQEVNEIVPELTFTNKTIPEEYMGVHYDDVTALLVEAIKEIASGSTSITNNLLNTQTVVAEDNNIDLNFGGTQQTAIDGGIRVLHAKGIDLSADFMIDANGDWTTNNDLKPKQITIPLFTPSGSTDTTGGLSNITRDDAYIYVKCSDGWKRSNLESF